MRLTLPLGKISRKEKIGTTLNEVFLQTDLSYLGPVLHATKNLFARSEENAVCCLVKEAGGHMIGT